MHGKLNIIKEQCKVVYLKKWESAWQAKYNKATEPNQSFINKGLWVVSEIKGLGLKIHPKYRENDKSNIFLWKDGENKPTN